MGGQPEGCGVYGRTLTFDLSSVVQQFAGPSNPHRRVPTSELAARGIAGKVENEPGLMPDGAVIIAAITSCTNTSNPRNVVAAGLLARARRTRWAWCANPGSSFAPLQGGQLYLEEGGCCPRLEKFGFGIVGFACTTCNGMSGALDPRIQQGDHRSRSLCHRGAVGQPETLMAASIPICEAGVPGLTTAGRRLCAIAGTIRFDIENEALGTDGAGNPVTLKDIWPSDEEIDAIVNASVKPEQFRQVYIPMFAASVESGERSAVV